MEHITWEPASDGRSQGAPRGHGGQMEPYKETRAPSQRRDLFTPRQSLMKGPR